MSGSKAAKRRGANRGEHADGRVPPVETGHDGRARERGAGEKRPRSSAEAPDGISGGWS